MLLIACGTFAAQIALVGALAAARRASSTAPARFARASDAASTNPTTVSAPWRHSKRMLAGSPAANRSASMPPSSAR